jgi:hypothetical protein
LLPNPGICYYSPVGSPLSRFCAEGVGFEPTGDALTPPTVFKTAAIDQLCHPSGGANGHAKSVAVRVPSMEVAGQARKGLRSITICSETGDPETPQVY